MEWSVLLHPEFDPEFAELPEAAQDELAALSQLLKHFGPQLSCPHADTLNGSKHANMKELRLDRRFDAHLADLKEVKNAQDDRRPNEKLAGKPARKGGRPRKGPRR